MIAPGKYLILLLFLEQHVAVTGSRYTFLTDATCRPPGLDPLARGPLHVAIS